MPELPEVEVLKRHLAPLLRGRRVRGVEVLKERSIRPNDRRRFVADLSGRTIVDVRRRAKYIRLCLCPKRGCSAPELLCHLGMTGRLFLVSEREVLPEHAAVVLRFDKDRLVFQDVRQFGRMTCDMSALDGIGPEPLAADFPNQAFSDALRRRRSPVRNLLLDQSLIAGLGNIYAGEALFVARIHPLRKGTDLDESKVRKLAFAIRKVLGEAVELGSSLVLDWKGEGSNDGLFYFGSGDANPPRRERFLVYGREGEPCRSCRTPIERMRIGGRGSFVCPRCQR